MVGDAKNLSGYLRAYGKALASGITEKAEPLFNPGDPVHPSVKKY